jgi:hypothetical protein
MLINNTIDTARIQPELLHFYSVHTYIVFSLFVLMQFGKFDIMRHFKMKQLD